MSDSEEGSYYSEEEYTDEEVEEVEEEEYEEVEEIVEEEVTEEEDEEEEEEEEEVESEEEPAPPAKPIHTSSASASIPQEPQEEKRKPKAYNSTPSNFTGMEKPTIATGGAMNFDALAKQREQKDLCELQDMIQKHFVQRQKDDEELDDLKRKMEERKAYRAEQQKIRLQREKERQKREQEERERREAEEQRKKELEEAKKKAAIANMSAHYGGYLNRQRAGNNRKQTEREKKREALAKRRKPLNIDHLGQDRLISKAKELHEYFAQLEEERYQAEDRFAMQKWEITSLRQRVQEFIAKSGKGPKKMQIKTVGGGLKNMSAFK